MPFATGRTIYGFPKETDGSLARLASAFHAVRPGETTYSPATYVYQWCSTGWELIWGAAIAPPTGVTAVWVAAGTKVRVSWVAPAINLATSYTVRRFDGSIVASGVTALTVDDDLPTPGTGTYTVEATNGTAVSTRAASPTLSINLICASASAVASGETIVVSWTPNAAGDPDYWKVYNATDGGWLSGNLAGNVRSFQTTSMTPGRVFTLGVYPFLSNVQDNGRNANPVGIPPRPTRPQSWGASGISNLAYTFWGPDAGAADSYDMDYYITSWVPWAYGITSGGPHNLGTTQCAYVRSRTNSAGMSSPWTQSGPACPVNDVTGPPSTAVSVGAWDIGQAALNVSWPSHYDSSGNGITRLQYSINGGGWQEQSVAYPAGPAWSGLTGGFGRGVQVSFRLRMTDALGNETYGPASANVWTRPLGGGIVYPNLTKTWGAQSGWGWLGNDRVIGGNYGGNENYGFWFYGTAIQDFCHTHTPDRMYFWSHKVSGLSSSGIAYIAWHNGAYYDGGVPGVGDIFHAPNLAVNADNTQFGAGWYPGFANGTYRGACVIGNGAAFKALYGLAEDGNSGAMTIYFDA
jgi:hypothetical protein